MAYTREKYIRDAVEMAYGYTHDYRRYLNPRPPKGAELYLRAQKSGELYPRALYALKSKGRTGAAVRSAIAREIASGREVMLHNGRNSI